MLSSLAALGGAWVDRRRDTGPCAGCPDRLGRRPLRHTHRSGEFFQTTSVFLLLFAVQLLFYAFHEFTGDRPACRSTTNTGTSPPNRTRRKANTAA